MALTNNARNKLFRLVQQSKKLLYQEIADQLQLHYGIFPKEGKILLVEELTTSDADVIYTAKLLRDRLKYLADNLVDPDNKIKESIDQLIREQAFSILNRMAALRMAEERGIIKETVGGFYNSEGFQVYDSITGQGAITSFYTRYKWYVQAVFDELALDLPSIFDRFSPYALIFPSEKSLQDLLEIINNEEVSIHREEGLQPLNLWKDDETIGWIYQYYNSREEITALRDASAAPRNSRELAVRNQFFTPRYVVQFLTDNSLGRIWYEMTKGKTELVSVCQYLIRRPKEIFLDKGQVRPENSGDLSEYIEHRPLKDPREILLLDPACGSMHFGLYSFDLLEVVYREAWDNYPELLTDLRLRMTRQQFLWQIPEFIIRYNIHGVDIDPRALQIAALSLWLRAQKSFEKLRLPAIERPSITKSNLVLAEGMPGNPTLLAELVKPLDKPMRQLMLAIWEKMKLAGEMGVLLRIETEIDETIKVIASDLSKEAKETQLQLGAGEIESLAAEGAAFYSTRKYRDSFLSNAEAQVLVLLKQLAESADNGDSYHKLLFAEDTARGFSFIELSRKKYDVVVMNPPFGLGLKKNFDLIKKNYPDAYIDLLATFLQRGYELTSSHVAAITSRSILLTPKLERIRLNTIIKNVSAIIDLGSPVMDTALVHSAAYVLSKSNHQNNFLVVDRRGYLDKDYELSNSLSFLTNDEHRYIVQRETLFFTPRNKILYNLSRKVLRLFQANKKLLDMKIIAKQGMKSFDDFRFVRIRQEVSASKIGKNKKWRSFSKGGRYSLFYSDLEVLVLYDKDGLEVQEVNRQKFNMTAQARQASSYYYLEGGNFSRRSSRDFGIRILPKDFVIGEKGPLVLSENKNISNLLLIGLLNSSFYNYLINIQANANQYDTGIIENLPYFEISHPDAIEIENVVKNAINALRKYDSSKEECSLFHSLPITFGLDEILRRVNDDASLAEGKIKHALAVIDKIVDKTLDIDSTILANAIDQFADQDDTQVTGPRNRTSGLVPLYTKKEISQRLVSYVFGILCGRWHNPKTIQPAITFSDSNIFENFNGKVPGLSEIDSTDIIMDVANDSYSLFDKKINEFLFEISGSNDLASELCRDIGALSFVDYFLAPSGFFEQHVNLYSSSRRIAPIYWPLSTKSGGYTVWLYYPKLNDQTLYKVVNNFVKPKQGDVEESLRRLQLNANPDNQVRRKSTELRELLHELKDMESELLRIAAFPYKPSQDDGVLITAAPLYKFFRHNKWRNSTEECWKALEKGEYDWAHLALPMWPERVTEKCKKDLSIAIAHGLEEICEIKPKEQKPRTKKEPKELKRDLKLDL